MTRDHERTTLLALALLTVVAVVNELAAGDARLIMMGVLGIGLLAVVAMIATLVLVSLRGEAVDSYKEDSV